MLPGVLTGQTTMPRGARPSPLLGILLFLILLTDQTEKGKGGKRNLLFSSPFWFVVYVCVYELVVSDLPGLYYDPVKNRYFPVKDRGAPSTAAPARSDQPEVRFGSGNSIFFLPHYLSRDWVFQWHLSVFLQLLVTCFLVSPVLLVPVLTSTV